MNLGHVIYNIPENTFEEFLEPAELHAMSNVSKMTRQSEQAVKFRAMREFLLSNTKMCLPLRTLAKQSGYSVKELYDLAEYLWNVGSIDTFTVTFFRAEMGDETRVNAAVNDMLNLCEYHMESIQEAIELGYDMSLIDAVASIDFDISKLNKDLLTMFSQGMAYKAFEYIFNTIDANSYIYVGLGSLLYFIDPNIRALYIKKARSDCDKFMERSISIIGAQPKNIDGFALSMESPLLSTLNYAIMLQDYDLFIAYFKQYFNVVPESYIRNLFKAGLPVTGNKIRILYNKAGGYSLI